MTNNYQINSLSPSSNLEKNESYLRYEKRLVSALNDVSVKNIALTGIYGSGKSSILETFKKNQANKEWNFLDISLSTFKVDDTSNDNDTPNKLTPEKIQLIERSILQQFFYSVPQDEIPLSRFKRITTNTFNSHREVFGLITLIIWSYLFVFNKASFITNYISFASWHVYLHLAIFITFLLVLLFKVFSYAMNLREIKFKLHDAEFNIKNEENKSILNDHLDEILYFFETTKKNVVIIEDLDRFNDTEIFIRLRELNSIVNKSCTQRVVFLYAIRDNMFKDTERSKFFEYIIPVIPIINPTNAYDLIQDKYKQVIHGVDNAFLRKTCLYFDDLRLLINILNEYDGYLEHLGNIHLDKNKLFAIMVYKNYYPSEFSKLNSNDGEIYNLFNEFKSTLVNNKLDENESNINDLIKKKEDIQAESVTSINELNKVYAYQILSNIPEMFEGGYYDDIEIIILCDNETRKIKDLETTELLEKLSAQNKFTLKTKQSNFNVALEFEDIESSINKSKSYLQRLELIEQRKNGEFTQINNKINSIKKGNQQVKALLLKELLQESELNIEKPLLRFFVTNGYIDETYTDYISHFFESSITKNDKEYAMLVGARLEPNFVLAIKNHAELLSNYIAPEELATFSALNFSMLDFLLQNNDFANLKNILLDTAISNNDFATQFIKDFVNRNENLSLFIPQLIDKSEKTIDTLVESYDDEQSIKNIIKLIQNLPIDNLSQYSYVTNKLKSFLENQSDYITFVLDCFDNDIEKFKLFTKEVKPKLQKIECKGHNSNLFNWLGENERLGIQKDIIKQAVLFCTNESDMSTIENNLISQPFTTILSCEDSFLINDFWSVNIEDYINLYISDTTENGKLDESEELFIQILNFEDLPQSIKLDMIPRFDTKINDLSEIKDTDLHSKLIESDNVVSKWENIHSYYELNERFLNETLIDFLNKSSNITQLLNDDFHTSSDKEFREAIESSLIQCDEINHESYSKIIPLLTYSCDSIGVSSISEDKILTLITNNKLNYTTKNWDNIVKLENKKLRNDFLNHHYEKILLPEVDVALELQDYEFLVSESKLSKSNKQALLKNKCIALIAQSTKLQTALIQLYDREEMPISLLTEIKNHSNTNQIKTLLKYQTKHLSKEELLDILEKIGEPYSNLVDSDLVEFEKNDINLELLTELNKSGLITKPYKQKVKDGLLKSKEVYETRRQKSSF